jgi:anti-sigma factor RsiW
MNCKTTLQLLNGFIDDELDLMNHLQIEEHLQKCSKCKQEANNLRAIKAAAADSSLYFKASAGFQEKIQASLRKNQNAPTESSKVRVLQWQWLAFAGLTILVIVFGALFFQKDSNNEELLAKEIVSGHIRSLMANHLTDVLSTDKHTVKPWFDGKLDFSPPVSDLTSQGFPLSGGRIDYVGNRPVAALVYQRKLHFINLFVFPSEASSDSGNKMFVRQGYNLITWTKSGMTFWVISDLNLGELQEFSQAIQN